MSVKQNSRKVSKYKNTEDQIFHICQPITVQVRTRDLSRDDWIKRIYKTEMKLWAVLGSRGCREKKLPTSISMQLFASALKSYIKYKAK